MEGMAADLDQAALIREEPSQAEHGSEIRRLQFQRPAITVNSRAGFPNVHLDITETGQDGGIFGIKPGSSLEISESVIKVSTGLGQKRQVGIVPGSPVPLPVDPDSRFFQFPEAQEHLDQFFSYFFILRINAFGFFKGDGSLRRFPQRPKGHASPVISLPGFRKRPRQAAKGFGSLTVFSGIQE